MFPSLCLTNTGRRCIRAPHTGQQRQSSSKSSAAGSSKASLSNSCRRSLLVLVPIPLGAVLVRAEELVQRHHRRAVIAVEGRVMLRQPDTRAPESRHLPIAIRSRKLPSDQLVDGVTSLTSCAKERRKAPSGRFCGFSFLASRFSFSGSGVERSDPSDAGRV